MRKDKKGYPKERIKQKSVNLIKRFSNHLHAFYHKKLLKKNYLIKSQKFLISDHVFYYYISVFCTTKI